jgi:transposase-like protein
MLFFVLLAPHSTMSSEERESLHRPPTCPKCGSNDIRRSKSDGFYAAVQRAFGRWPFRCRSCRARFYRASNPPMDMDHSND